MSFLQLVLSFDKTIKGIILLWRICQFDRYRNTKQSVKCQGVKEFYMVARWGQTLATGRLLYKDRILPFPKYIDPSPLLDKLTLRASSETVCGLMDSSSCINVWEVSRVYVFR